MARGKRAPTTRTAGLSTVAVGTWLLGVGLWARADVRRSLAGEQAISTDDWMRSGQPVTGAAVPDPAHALWVQATTLQTALMQAYLAQRLAELTAGLGATFIAVGAGLTVAARR
jgi:hypothetical protein